MKKYLFVLSVAIAMACNNDSVKIETETLKNENVAVKNDSTEIKNWLKVSIEDLFKIKEEKNFLSKLKSIVTNDYYNYKQDALDVELDNGDTTKTQANFESKWKHKYNTKLVGDGGFIISGQDYGLIKVSQCDFIKQENETYWFKVLIKDETFKLEYKREIKVVKENSKFKIEDIIESN